MITLSFIFHAFLDFHKYRVWYSKFDFNSIYQNRNQDKTERNPVESQNQNSQKEIDLGLIPAIYNSLRGMRKI